MVDKENQQKGVQFQFRKRYRKVDWKLLANVDIEKIVRDLDYHALQTNIMNVAFCDTKSQDFMDVDEDIIKLYRLGQYTIEYLLHCQEYLSHGTVELETKLREALRFRNEVKEKLEIKQKELTEAKKESRKRKKMIAVYQSMLNTEGSSGFHRCEHCSKAFISAPFLSSHLERRHGIVQPSTLNSEDKLRIANEDLGKELENLKENNKNLEDELEQAKVAGERALTLRDSTLDQQLQQEEAHKRWVKETEDKQKEEIEKVKAIYLKEASEALEQKRIAELALVESKKGLVSNLGALRDEKQEHEVQYEQQLSQLKDQYEGKLSKLQRDLETQSRKQHDQEKLYVAEIHEAYTREEALRKQLDADQRVRKSVEVENASSVHIYNEEEADVEYAPKNVSTHNGHENSGASVEVVQKVKNKLPASVLQEPYIQTPTEVSPVKEHVPFADKPYLKTQYEHPSQAIAAARKELETDLADRLLHVAGNQGVESLSTEEYNQCKDKIDRSRMSANSALQIQQLESEVSNLAEKHKPTSPKIGLHPTSLPPKSPSFKAARELLSRPNSSKRTKTSAPGDDLHDHIRASRGIGHLDSGSTPDLAAGNLIASTPKLSSRSVDNISKPSQQQMEACNFDDEDSEESDVSDIEVIETTPAARDVVMPTREGSRGESRDLQMGDLESDVSEEEEVYEEEDELENPFDDETETSTQQTPRYSLRDPNYNPLDEDSAEEEVEDTVELSPSPEPEVKRREKKSYSRDSVDDSIFSFDGWSKMKNRNSMSADDAQQNIPMGHVSRMRQAVDTLNKQKRAQKSIGVEILSPQPPRKTPDIPENPDRDEEDDFTVSSLSERDDLSPTVGMKVDIKRSSSNGGVI